VPGREYDEWVPVHELKVVQANLPPTVTPTDFPLRFTLTPGMTENDFLIRKPTASPSLRAEPQGRGSRTGLEGPRGDLRMHLPG
jgi:hypothetical protein